MRGPKPTQIELSAPERQGLENLIKAHNTRQQIALRSRIILKAAEGKNNLQIAQELHIIIDTARLWRRRWLSLQSISLEDLSVEERLEDLPRPGAPAQIPLDQRPKIQKLACEKPEEAQRPITHWTNREIADEIMQRGIVEHISARHAARLLKRS